MAMSGGFVTGFMLLFLLAGISACERGSAKEADGYQAYIGGIDRSCTTDDDCVIRDVGNCCGYYPQCVNIVATTDKEKVSAWCEKEGMASVCGFPSIESCRCQDHACVNVEPAGHIQ